MKIINSRFVMVEMIGIDIAKITIQRKGAMNALNKEIVLDLKTVVNQLEASTDIACVIITGAGENFIAGADIGEMNGSSVTEAHTFSKEMKTLHDAIIRSKKPYIAAIHGYCLGGGLELALACDIRIASHTTKIGLPEINLGIIPGGGGIQRLAELTGLSFASQLVMTGEMIDVEQAKQWQIINSIHTDAEEKAISIARTICSKSHFAITASKKLLNQRRLKQSTMEFEEEMYEFALLFDHPDAFEGMSAFMEKRKPLFQKRRLD